MWPPIYALSVLVTLVAAQQQNQPGQPLKGVECRTGAELVSLLADPSVDAAYLPIDLAFKEDDWIGYNSTTVISRDFTISGVASRPVTLDLGFLREKVRLSNGITLSFCWLVLIRYRSGSAVQNPGLDILAPLRTGEQAMLILKDVYLLSPFCFPLLLIKQAVKTIKRPPQFPGENVVEVPSPVLAQPPACSNSTAAPVLERCFPLAGRYVDIGLYAADMQPTGRPLENGYLVHFRDCGFLCPYVLPDACINELGPVGCVLYALSNLDRPFITDDKNSRLPIPPATVQSDPGGSSPAASKTLSASTAAEDADDGSKGKFRLTVVLLSVLGGVTLVLLVAVALLFALRARRMRVASQAVLPSPNLPTPNDFVVNSKYMMRASLESDLDHAAGMASIGPSECTGRGHYGRWTPPFGVSVSASALHLSMAAVVTPSTPHRDGVRLDARLQAPCRSQAFYVSVDASASMCVVGQDASTLQPCVAGSHHHGRQQASASDATWPRDGTGDDNQSATAGHSVDSKVGDGHSHSCGMDLAGEGAAAVSGVVRGLGVCACCGGADSNVVMLLPRSLGKGASGRVHEGMYQGQRVAVKVVLGSDCYGFTQQQQPQQQQAQMQRPPQGSSQQLSGGAAGGGDGMLSPAFPGTAASLLLPGVGGSCGSAGDGTASSSRSLRALSGTINPGQPPSREATTTNSTSIITTTTATAEQGKPMSAEPSDDRLVTLFGREVDVLARCQHPNVVRLIAACIKPPRLCLVMELMDTSLERLIYGQAKTLIPLPTLLHIAVQICQGLAYLHPTIIHRDIKPANVLINGADSPWPVAKLSDFGLSRLRSATMPTLHPDAGTPAYLAPECYDLANDIISHHADMFALGVLLWAMLTGQEPWKDYPVVAVGYKVAVLKERLPLDQLSSRRCPPQLKKLVRKCWEQDPLRRPAAAEMVKELLTLLQQVQRNRESSTPSGSKLNFLGAARHHHASNCRPTASDEDAEGSHRAIAGLASPHPDCAQDSAGGPVVALITGENPPAEDCKALPAAAAAAAAGPSAKTGNRVLAAVLPQPNDAGGVSLQRLPSETGTVSVDSRCEGPLLEPSRQPSMDSDSESLSEETLLKMMADVVLEL